MREVLGIDIGGTGVKCAIIDIDSGKMLTERFKEATPQPATPEAVADVIKKQIRLLNWSGPIGCGLPSVIRKGKVATAANIDDAWIGLPANRFFSDALGHPTVVLNDADAAGVAEMKIGKGKNKNGVVLLMTIGTGIGSALFIDGKLVPNTEFGHLRFKGMAAEKYCSNSARKNEGLEYDVWAERLDEFLHHLNRICSPELILLGGGISKKFERYADCFTVPIKVTPAKLENTAGVIGAALAAEVLL